MKPGTRCCLAMSALALLGAPGMIALAADAWPARPIRLIVPFPPGGSNDIVARLVGAHLTERLGKTVVVDNRGGAGGRIGYETAATSHPDGHTLLVISAAYTFTPALHKLNFDPVKAFVPVAMMGRGANALTVFPGLGVNSVKELVAMAKARPGQLHYGSAGVGTFQHLGSELFRIMAGIDIVNVPYKGGGPSTLAVVAGQAQISIGTLIQTLPHVRPGRLKLLGTGGSKRVPILPDVPTISEAGVPGYEAYNWWGVVARPGRLSQSPSDSRARSRASSPRRRYRNGLTRKAPRPSTRLPRNSGSGSWPRWINGARSSGRPASRRSRASETSSAGAAHTYQAVFAKFEDRP